MTGGQGPPRYDRHERRMIWSLFWLVHGGDWIRGNAGVECSSCVYVAANYRNATIPILDKILRFSKLFLILELLTYMDCALAVPRIMSQIVRYEAWSLLCASPRLVEGTRQPVINPTKYITSRQIIAPVHVSKHPPQPTTEWPPLSIPDTA